MFVEVGKEAVAEMKLGSKDFACFDEG
jgi:hypothetical protein